MRTRWLILASWMAAPALALPAAGGVLCVATPQDIVAFDLSTGAVLSRYGLPATEGTIPGLAWDGAGYVVSSGTSTTQSGQIWETDHVFQGASSRFAVPVPDRITPKGIALHDGWLYVNGQSTSARDTLYALDPVTGTVQHRFAMPDTVTNLQDLTSDGTYLWGVESSPRRLSRIDPATGAFEFSAPLPGSSQGFAIAYDPDLQMLWWVAAGVAYRIDPATLQHDGTTVEVSEPINFAVAAVYRDQVVPIVQRTWGALKDAFRGR